MTKKKLLFFLLILFSTDSAHAQSIGEQLKFALSDTIGPFFFVISLISMVVGVFLIAKGLFELKDASNTGHGPTQHHLTVALIKMLFGSMLVALPELAGVGVTSVFGTGVFNSDMAAAKTALDSPDMSNAKSSFQSFIDSIGVTSPTTCSSGDVTCMAKNIAQNFVPIAVIAVFLTAFLSGVFLFAKSLIALARSQDNHSGGPLTSITPLFISVLLINSPYLFTLAANTLMGSTANAVGVNGVNSTSSLFSYSIGATGALATYSELIGWCLFILAFFGVFAFVKGVFLLKAIGEGKGQHGIGHAFTFMVSGVLLANAKYTVCMVLTTIGSTTLGFC